MVTQALVCVKDIVESTVENRIKSTGLKTATTRAKRKLIPPAQTAGTPQTGGKPGTTKKRMQRWRCP
jgi:hypothetical protein